MAKLKRGSSINSFFLPNEKEIKLVSKIQKLIGNDYRLIRCTYTMLNKSIIDASGQLRELFLKYGIIDYSLIQKGTQNKIVKDVGLIVTTRGIIETKVSFYRPTTKNGDPRFWFYNSKRHLLKDKLLFITVSKNKLVGIPVIEDEGIFDLISKYLSSTKSTDHISIFRTLYGNHKDQWIESVSPLKSNPKDVGDTLEKIIGIKANSSIKADINGLIEIKSKRTSTKANDSLFSKTPNWKISPIKSSREMILKYGYVGNAHKGFMDLYVTVNAKPNNQGLLLLNNNKDGELSQYHAKDGLTCIWEHQVLKNRLIEKHPNTIWVQAEEKTIKGKIYFRYKNEMKYTSNPIFSQFLTLLESSIITFDWRGKVKPDGTKYRDHGHGFRISSKNRILLFDEEKDFSI